MLVILSGGRPKENIRQLVDQGEKDAGYPTEDVSSDEARDEGCTGRNVYHYGNPCVQHDDFHSLILKIKTVSLICVCFPPPLYFWTFSAKLKAFVGRFYCLAQNGSEFAADPL